MNCIHGDEASEIPKEAVLYGSSENTKHELWTIGDRVLSMQPHPELNNFIIQKFVIDKLHSLSRINSDQKHLFEQDLYKPELKLVRHIMLRVIYAFLK